MISRQELSKLFETLFPSMQDYGPNGLQVEGKETVEKIAFSVSASVSAIEKSVQWGADALFVHHGMFWEKMPRIVIGTQKKKLELLLKHGVSLFAYHLPLDAHQELGNNFRAAKEMGWKNLRPFGEIGVQGEFSSRSRETFLKELEAYYKSQGRTALGGKEQVTTAALVSGGAWRMMEEACGVDCFITGNCDEPAWHIAFEEQINFYSMGHYATERVGVRAVMAHLEEKGGIQCSFFDEPNPF